MRIPYVGGPMDGKIEENNDPAPMIIPKGSPMSSLDIFLSGGPITCPHYRLADDKRRNRISEKAYVWYKPPTS